MESKKKNIATVFLHDVPHFSKFKRQRENGAIILSPVNNKTKKSKNLQNKMETIVQETMLQRDHYRTLQVDYNHVTTDKREIPTLGIRILDQYTLQSPTCDLK